jgi:hypothetical protein
MEINVGGFDTAVQQATGAVVDLSAAVQAMAAASRSYQTAQEHRDKARADLLAADELDRHGKHAAAKKAREDAAQQMRDYTVAEGQGYVSEMQARLDRDMANHAGAGVIAADQQALLDAQKVLAEREAENSVATQGNTAATNALNHAMTNVPAIFKTAQVVSQVLSGQFGSGVGADPASVAASLGGRSAPGLRDRIDSILQGGTYNEVVVNGDIHVSADSEDVFAAIKRKLSEDKRVRTGSSARDLTNRFANLGQG